MSEDQFSENEKRLHETRQMWDDAAASFDDEADHGLRDPVVRAGWINLLRAALPPAPVAILDIGCGTGSLSLILAELGHRVSGIDLSPAMITLAETKTKAAGYSIHFQVMDAAFPQFAPQQFDAVVCRHLLWSLSPIDQVLLRWAELLKPGGRLLLIEGFWNTGAGLHAQDIIAALPASLPFFSVQDLSDQPVLWGGSVSDERYAIVARG